MIVTTKPWLRLIRGSSIYLLRVKLELPKSVHPSQSLLKAFTAASAVTSALAGLAPVTMRPSVCANAAHGPGGAMSARFSCLLSSYHTTKLTFSSYRSSRRLDSWSVPRVDGVQNAFFLFALGGEAGNFSSRYNRFAGRLVNDARENSTAVANS